MATQTNKMKTIQSAIVLADKLQHVFVTTADTKGLPHVATAGKIRFAPNGKVEVSSWFCPCWACQIVFQVPPLLVSARS